MRPSLVRMVESIPMLDAFRNMSGGKGKEADKQATELELLIATAREERSAISAMLTALTTRSAKLSGVMTKSLEHVTEKATDVTSRLDDITSRVTSLDERTKGLDEVERRISSLKDTTQQAEQTTLKLVGPEGELQKHRDAFHQLSAQALETQTTVETLNGSAPLSRNSARSCGPPWAK